MDIILLSSLADRLLARQSTQDWTAETVVLAEKLIALLHNELPEPVEPPNVRWGIAVSNPKPKSSASLATDLGTVSSNEAGDEMVEFGNAQKLKKQFLPFGNFQACALPTSHEKGIARLYGVLLTPKTWGSTADSRHLYVYYLLDEETGLVHLHRVRKLVSTEVPPYGISMLGEIFSILTLAALTLADKSVEIPWYLYVVLPVIMYILGWRVIPWVLHNYRQTSGIPLFTSTVEEFVTIWE